MIIPENMSYISTSKKNKPITIKILIAELFIIAKNREIVTQCCYINLIITH